MSRPTILQLHRGPVHPPSNGEEVRVWKTAERLADRGRVLLAHPTDREGELAPGVRAVDTGNPFLARKATRIYAWYGALALGPDNPVDRLQSRATVAALDRRLSDVDLVCCESPQVHRAGARLADRHGAPLLLNKHNAMYELLDQQFAELGLPGPLRRRAVESLRTFEQRGVERADAVVFQSEDDPAAFEVPADTRTAVVPNGTDLAAIRAGGDPERARADLGVSPEATLCAFVGACDYDPNRVAAEHVRDRIAPACPDVEFVVVGRDPPKMDRPNVRAPGYVEDLPGVLAASDVALCPLTMGSGTKLKVMDYLAAGLPIVTTPVGTQGVPVRDGETALVRPVAQFPAAIDRLRESPELAARLAESARELGARYSWEGVLADYDPLVADLLGARASADD